MKGKAMTNESVFAELRHGGECDLPTSVAICPECGGNLSIDCNEWDSKTGVPTESGFDVSCEVDEENMDAWMYNDDDDRDMREVGHRFWQSDWQPVRDAVWEWIKLSAAVLSETERNTWK